MADQDALSGARFGGGGWLKEFPAKVRILTLDPMVYNNNFGQTKYAFIVFNLDEDKVQIFDTTPGNASRFKEIHMDEDYGANLRAIDVKIKTNGKSGINIRYTVETVGVPHNLTPEQMRIIYDAHIDLEKIVTKNNPGAVRLSEVNAGKKPGASLGRDNTLEPEDTVIEDIGDEPINLDNIPF